MLVALIAGALVIAVASAFLMPIRGFAAECGHKVSWYGLESCSNPKNCRTADGKKFNQWAMTTAHMTAPFGTKFRVSYKGRSVVVTVTDRGNFAKYGRTLDLSRGAFRKLANERAGVLRGVCIERVD